MKNENDIPGLIASLNDANSLSRTQAHQRLLRMGEPVIIPLMKVSLFESGRMSWEAAKVLAEIRDPRCFTLMQEFLLAGNAILAEIAARALENYGEEAIPTLLKGLKTTHPTVLLQIVTILERLGDPRAVQPLVELLQQTTSSSLRYTIIQALGVLGDPSLLPILLPYQNDENQHVRTRTEIAIQRINARFPTRNNNIIR